MTSDFIFIQSTLQTQSPKQQLPGKTLKRNHKLMVLEKTIQELNNEINQNSDEEHHEEIQNEKERFSEPGSAKMLSSPAESIRKGEFTFADFKKLIAADKKKTFKPIRHFDLASKHGPEKRSKVSDGYSPEKNKL